MSILTSLVSLFRPVATNIIRLLLLKILTNVPYQFDGEVQRGLEYDFIVVGGGVAGSVVAGRLASTGATVLVLEAGGPAPPESSVPGFFPLLLGQNVATNYRIKMASQRNTQQAFVNNTSHLILGRGMGGGSSVNGMVYTRGSREDFNHWADLGNLGWNFDAVLPFFKKSEDYRGGDTRNTDFFHGRGGPLRVQERSMPFPKLLTTFLMAGQEMGFNIIDDNGPTKIGFSTMQFTIRDGVRASASESFLTPQIGRKWLTVVTKARVEKIIFDNNRRATGVVYTKNNRKYHVRCKKEIVLSAGAINSPKLLMLSGVGPRRELTRHKIPVVASVEGVGRNLQDHISLWDFPFIINQEISFNPKWFLNLQNLKSYVKNQTGPFADTFSVEGSSFVNLGGGDSLSWPDVQLMMLSVGVTSLGQEASMLGDNIKPEVFSSQFDPLIGKGSMSINPGLLRPRSRGTVTLMSNNQRDDPIVDMNFLDHPDDLKILVKGIRFALKIAATESMRAIGTRFVSEPLPGCFHLPPNSDRYWGCFARHFVTSAFHPAGTCKMAPSSDHMGVVDSTLKLRGVSGVRVVDGSIMPTLVSANTMATIYMIGEMGADLIKKEYFL